MPKVYEWRVAENGRRNDENEKITIFSFFFSFFLLGMMWCVFCEWVYCVPYGSRATCALDIDKNRRGCVCMCLCLCLHYTFFMFFLSENWNENERMWDANEQCFPWTCLGQISFVLCSNDWKYPWLTCVGRWYSSNYFTLSRGHTALNVIKLWFGNFSLCSQSEHKTVFSGCHFRFTSE